jgi:hypothetical protein
MKMIKTMLDSAPSMETALEVLNWMHANGMISNEEFKSGKSMIKNTFSN